VSWGDDQIIHNKLTACSLEIAEYQLVMQVVIKNVIFLFKFKGT